MCWPLLAPSFPAQLHTPWPLLAGFQSGLARGDTNITERETGISSCCLADLGSGVQQWLPPRQPDLHSSSPPWAPWTMLSLWPSRTPVGCSLTVVRASCRCCRLWVLPTPCWPLSHTTVNEVAVSFNSPFETAKLIQFLVRSLAGWYNFILTPESQVRKANNSLISHA